MKMVPTGSFCMSQCFRLELGLRLSKDLAHTEGIGQRII